MFFLCSLVQLQYPTPVRSKLNHIDKQMDLEPTINYKAWGPIGRRQVKAVQL